MNKNKHYLFGLLALILLALACANPLAAPAPQEPANVETIVAATFAALTAAPSDGSAPPPTPQAGDSPSGLLPHSLFYLANDAAQISQVFRLDKDGKTITQLTFEPADVEEFDVSLVDGSLAFVTNNQLYSANADGSNRKMIVDGGAQDVNNPFLTNVGSPVFSPNGQTIAYGYKGLNFYAIASGQSNRVLEDQITQFDGGLSVPKELYFPERYSADGNLLLVTLGYYEGASTAIYYLNGGSLVRLSGGEGSIICCGDYSLSGDASMLFSASPTFGMFNAGLWRVDTNTGVVTSLLQSGFESNPVEVADNPFIAPDGQLYYFYASVPNTGDMINRPPLQLVRSGADGVNGRTVLRPETFTSMNEALWAPDASFVIAANAPNDQIYMGGTAELYPTDGSPMTVLLPFARDMRWGP